MDLHFVRYYTVVACLCAITNVNSKQCTLLLSHSSRRIRSQMEVTVDYLWKLSCRRTQRTPECSINQRQLGLYTFIFLNQLNVKSQKVDIEKQKFAVPISFSPGGCLQGFA